MALSAREISSFVKWRLVPVRYLGKLRYMRMHHLSPAKPPKGDVALEVAENGFATGPVRTGEDLKALQDLFSARAPNAAPEGLKAPFVNLSRAEDFTADNPLMKFAFSPDVLDVAIDYFGGRLRFDSLQVLHSFPNDGPLKESQKWHLDYGDKKSFHCVMYLNDVLDDDHGPFVFIDKKASQKVGRGLIVRRIPDDQLDVESGNAPKQVVYGKAGSSVLVDPAACYHYGSRCTSPRTAVFVTFNSDVPFMAPVPLLADNAQRIAEAGKQLRPDLDPNLIDRMLGLAS